VISVPYHIEPDGEAEVLGDPTPEAERAPAASSGAGPPDQPLGNKV
jgi:hypothetical protein